MDIETDFAGQNSSEDKLSDDSNLSSTSLVHTLVERSETDLSSFCNLSFEQKFKKISHNIKSSYYEQRESIPYDDSYNKDVEEHMRRTESDRRKSLKHFYIPKYSSDDLGLKRTFSRPDLSEFHIPLMTRFSNKLEHGRGSISSRNSNSTYVGRLLTISEINRQRPRRVSTIRLDQYKQKIKGEEDDVSVKKQASQLNDDYTAQEKKMIDEVLGDIPFREESVYVPYGKLSYLRELPDTEGEEPTNLFSPSVELRLPSYDESLILSKDMYQSRSFRSNEKNQGYRTSMWDRTPSNYEFTLNTEAKKTEKVTERRKSVRFCE